MTMEEKNQYIEQYINNISLQVNSQYGKELIDKDKIDRALTMFKDSSADLETEIIPKINQLAQQVIEDYLEQQRQMEEMMRKQQEINNLISQKINELNERYPNLISDDLKNSAINNYINSNKSIEDIDKEVSSILTTMSQEQEELLSTINSVEAFNPNEIDTKLNTNNQGIYLSSLMTSTLSLINCSDINEINAWIDKVPNLYMVSSYDSAKYYSTEQIELIKRELFDMYQDSMISTEVINEINVGNKEESMRYALHKKLSGLNLSLEDELKLGDIGLSQGLPALYSEVEKICIAKYGDEKGSKISNKIVNYYTTDFENFNSSTYDQMQSLNEEIKSNIQKCNLSGGSFQLVISSLNYGNTVNAIGNGKFEFNYGISEMGQELAEKLGSSYRLRSVINRNAADEMISRGFTKENKEQVIQILRDSLTSSLQSFNSNIKPDGKNRTFELFNELVEIQKADKDYKCVWEDRFGITLEDMVRQVIVPNGQLLQELKSKNVDFMYNETLLQESQEKRDKVMETMVELQKYAPGLITVWADQDHTFGSDYSKEKIEQLKAVAEFDKKMAETIFKKDEQNAIISFTDKSDLKVKLECSEKDLYLSQAEVRKMKQKGMSKQDILKYKQGLENKHNEIFGQVPFERKCEWTVLDNLSGEYYQHGMDTKQDSYIGKYTKISDMARKDNSRRINKDRSDFNNWKNAVNQVKQQKQSTPIQQPAAQEKPKPFAQRSQSEIQVHNQIKEKNQAVKQQKEQQRQMNKPKVKTLTQNPNGSSTGSKGFANIITLSLIVSFVCGALFMVVYMLIKG